MRCGHSCSYLRATCPPARQWSTGFERAFVVTERPQQRAIGAQSKGHHCSLPDQ